MSNIPGGNFRLDPSSNAWILAIPTPDDTQVPCFDAAGDTGLFVKAILTHREQLLGKQVRAATDYYTPKADPAVFQRAFPGGR